MDKYTDKYLERLKYAFNKKDMDGVRTIINKIYEDGFEDGKNEEGGLKKWLN